MRALCVCVSNLLGARQRVSGQQQPEFGVSLRGGGAADAGCEEEEEEEDADVAR